MSTEGSIPPQEFMAAKKDECSHMEVEKALDILSKYLAQSNKLTTCDLLCLSHLKERVRSH